MDQGLKHEIQDYLYYGYVPVGSDLRWLSCTLTGAGEAPDYSPDGAANLLDKTIDSAFGDVEFKNYCVIPISGGWDSRVLLGAALQRLDRCNIKTLSYGVPGQLDYDIGRQISRCLDVEHHAVDLSKIELRWEDLLADVRLSPWTYVPDSYFNRLAVTEVARSSSDVVLSGFLGEALTGGHFSGAQTRNDSLREFILRERREKRIWLPGSDYDPTRLLREIKFSEGMCSSEALDLGVRQSNCVSSIVTPRRRWRRWGCDMGRMVGNGPVVLAPFSCPAWAGYWIRAPKKLKCSQRLYREMIGSKFPNLATLPSKYSLGCSSRTGYFSKKLSIRVRAYLNFIAPQAGLRYKGRFNYLDYASAFRERADYRLLLSKSFDYLRSKDLVPWLDLENLRREHLTFVASNENVFLILIGLAVNHASATASEITTDGRDIG